MICRFFCAMHKCHHFLAELTDDLDNAACLEIGERATSPSTESMSAIPNTNPLRKVYTRPSTGG